MKAAQQHLDGSATPLDAFERERPGTYLWDRELEEWRFRGDIPIDEQDRCRPYQCWKDDPRAHARPVVASDYHDLDSEAYVSEGSE